MSTPHNSAEYGDFGKVVLLPGDPVRAKNIAETFLTDIRLINDVRGANGYTGYVDGLKISVMSSGMGMPSVGIHTTELFKYYGVDAIIRVGTIGAIQRNIRPGSIIIAQGSCTDSNMLSNFVPTNGTFAPICDIELLKIASAFSNCETLVGNILATDSYYGNVDSLKIWSDLGVLGVEMESAILYTLASKYRKAALTICTVSDNIITGESLSSDLRSTDLSAAELAIDTAKQFLINRK